MHSPGKESFRPAVPPPDRARLLRRLLSEPWRPAAAAFRSGFELEGEDAAADDGRDVSPDKLDELGRNVAGIEVLLGLVARSSEAMARGPDPSVVTLTSVQH